jgi:phospholipid/cholesterol/gamma-HCH transport system substrate-binding protein
MAHKAIDNVKLGIFVLAGLVMLIFALYMVGKDTNLFSKNYTLKVRFDNVSGLMVGNNIRYAGIQVGTVKKITLLNDTIIEVTMLVDEVMKQFIHKKDLASIGTDGLVGNKLINIIPGKEKVLLAENGDLLQTKVSISTEDMLEVLDKTNKNVAEISEGLKMTVNRLNNSTAFWKILNEKTLPDNLKATLINIRNASKKADNMIVKADNIVADLQTVVQDVKNGKGSIGGILKDTLILANLNLAVEKIKMVGDNANNLSNELNTLTQGIQQDINHGKGTINYVLKDTSLVQKLNKSLEHIEEGTSNFNQNMEALKHNFFFKGYFKKLEKEKKKAEELKYKQKKAASL